jgi:hypothetical protein
MLRRGVFLTGSAFGLPILLLGDSNGVEVAGGGVEGVAVVDPKFIVISFVNSVNNYFFV